MAELLPITLVNLLKLFPEFSDPTNLINLSNLLNNVPGLVKRFGEDGKEIQAFYLDLEDATKKALAAAGQKVSDRLTPETLKKLKSKAEIDAFVKEIEAEIALATEALRVLAQVPLALALAAEKGRRDFKILNRNTWDATKPMRLLADDFARALKFERYMKARNLK